MSEQFSGRVTIVDNQGREAFKFDSQFAVLDLGVSGNEGDLRLRGDDGEDEDSSRWWATTRHRNERGQCHGVPVRRRELRARPGAESGGRHGR